LRGFPSAPELPAYTWRIIFSVADFEEGTMVRERIQRVALIITGLLFLALIYPGVMFFSREPAVPMIMSIYVTLGIFLLLAARNPSANRSLIAFAGWANVAHAGVMALQEYRHVIEPRELIGVVAFGIVGVVLIALAPAEGAVKQISSAKAA
jgi:succinate-acetate transporter protein